MGGDGYYYDEHNEDGSDDICYDFILSNGEKSTFARSYSTYMIPADALHKIRSVTIHYSDVCIWCFSFFDKDGALLWKIGYYESWSEYETVMLAENEVIVGVVGKHSRFNQSAYTDF